MVECGSVAVSAMSTQNFVETIYGSMKSGINGACGIS